MFMALIVFLYRSPFGFWLAGSLAVLTLIHELGHAGRCSTDRRHTRRFHSGFWPAMRHTRPTRELSRAEQAWISFAGPFVHIGTSVAVLIAMGVNPIEPSSSPSSPAAAAIWWAGPAIGAMNLIPVLPLDGGNIVIVRTRSTRSGTSQAIHALLFDRCDPHRCRGDGWNRVSRLRSVHWVPARHPAADA